MLNYSLEHAQSQWLKALQRFVGIATRVKVREFSSDLPKEQLPDADDQLLLQLNDSEVQYGLQFNTALRRSQWAEGARSRLEIFKELGRQAHTSTSHSIIDHKVRVLTIGASRNGLLGIGADIESDTRVLREQTRGKFLTTDELTFDLKTLELWCIKEAAWKSHPTRQGTVLSQYRLHAQLEDVYLLEGPRGEKIKAILCPVPGWVAAFATSGL